MSHRCNYPYTDSTEPCERRVADPHQRYCWQHAQGKSVRAKKTGSGGGSSRRTTTPRPRTSATRRPPPSPPPSWSEPRPVVGRQFAPETSVGRDAAGHRSGGGRDSGSPGINSGRGDPSRRHSEADERLQEQAIELILAAAQSGVLDAVAERAVDYTDERVWKLLRKKWRPHRCRQLAKLARAILDGKKKLHQLFGTVADKVLVS